MSRLLSTTLITLFVAATGLSACGAKQEGAAPTAEAASDHRAAVKKGAPLIDVRTPEEFAGGHVEGAVNIPVDEVPSRAADIAKLAGADKTVVVYCRSGKRSARAAETLRQSGLTVLDIGPMSAW